MFKKSIVRKIIFALVISTVLANVITGYVISNRVLENADKRIEDEANIVLKSLSFAINTLLESNDEKALEDLLIEASEEELIYLVRIYTDDQFVLYSSVKSDVGFFIRNGCVQKLVEGNLDKKFEKNYSKQLYQVAIPLNSSSIEGETNSYRNNTLFVSIDMDYAHKIGEQIGADLQLLFNIFNVAFILIIILLLDALLNKPLKKLKLQLEYISDNDYDSRLDMKSNSEFSEIANTVNEMARNIKNNTEKLIDAKKIAEEASNSKMRFLANMSHEIRTPLNSIIGFTELLEEKEFDEDKKNQLQIVNRSGKHLLSLISDILDFSKIESEQIELEKSNFNVRMLIKEIREMFYLSFKEKGIGFRYEIDNDVPINLVGDVYRIKQIIINIINNAIKFTEIGHVVIFVSYEDGNLSVSISDTGIGIERDKIVKIFDVFAQSDNSTTRVYGGSGLGLSISRKLAIIMGGDIYVSSEVGRGSEFKIVIGLKKSSDYALAKDIDAAAMVEKWLAADSELEDLVRDLLCTLPLKLGEIMSDFKSNQINRLKRKVHAFKGLCGNYQLMELYDLIKEVDKILEDDLKIDMEILENYLLDIEKIIDAIPDEYKCEVSKEINHIHEKGIFKILLAEDILENRLLVKKILEDMNVEIETAHNGLEAINKIDENKYDLLLLDIQMPLLDGTEVLEWIRSNNMQNDMYIIALTANATKNEMEEYISKGSNWFLSKPIKKELIREKVDELIKLKLKI